MQIDFRDDENVIFLKEINYSLKFYFCIVNENEKLKNLTEDIKKLIFTF